MAMDRSETEDRSALSAAGPGELSGLKAFFAEHWASLRRFERYRRVFTAGRAGGGRFHALACRPAAVRPAGPLALARFAPLRFVLEVLVGEKLLFSRRPDELPAAVHAVQDPVLKLHRSLPRRRSFPTRCSYARPLIPTRAGASSDCACVPMPASPAVCRPALDRRSAS